MSCPETSVKATDRRCINIPEERRSHSDVWYLTIASFSEERPFSIYPDGYLRHLDGKEERQLDATTTVY
jgi:hypothetical protein